VGALGTDDYVRFVQPYSPVIHFGTGASGFFCELHATAGDVGEWTGASISTRPERTSAIARRCKATWTRWPCSRRCRS
jgi:hypothetical protein